MKKGVKKSIIWKVAMVLGLIALVLAIIPACGQGTTPAPTPTPAATPKPTPAPTPAPAGAPVTPANHVGRATCKMCHDGGLGGAPKFPAAPSHAGFTDDLKTCQACHKGP